MALFSANKPAPALDRSLRRLPQHVGIIMQGTRLAPRILRKSRGTVLPSESGI